MWSKIKSFFKEVGIVMEMIADGEMEYMMEQNKEDNSSMGSGDYDTGPM